MQMLYQRELSGNSPEFVLDHFEEFLQAPQEVRRFARKLLLGVVEHLDEIDDLIRAQAENWKLTRMAAVDRNLLRMAVFEMVYVSSSPPLVVIDEAIEIAKRYGSEKSSRFVNGLLDGVHKELERERLDVAGN